MKINGKHKQVAENYLVNFNMTKSYMMEYPSSSYESARRAASNLFKREEVQEYLAERLDELTIRNEEIIFGISDIARNPDETTPNRLRAYEMLAKVKGLFIDRIDVTTKGKAMMSIEDFFKGLAEGTRVEKIVEVPKNTVVMSTGKDEK